jgi:hypothetical protein
MTRRPLLAVLLVVAAACGRKGAPLAPEVVQPEAPSALTATSTPEGVRLTWRRPERYTGGSKMNDLGEFRVERASPDEARTVFRRVAVVPLEDRFRFRKERRIEWADRDAAAGRTYLYRVFGVTLDGYVSEPAGPVTIRHEPKPAPPEPAP